jgi:hypothetical protein
MSTACPVCEWIVRYRKADLSPTERSALVEAEVTHLWRHHGQAVSK